MSEAAAICADYGYLTPAETLIKSIAYHNHDLPIYLLNTNIPQEWFLNINRRLAPSTFGWSMPSFPQAY